MGTTLNKRAYTKLIEENIAEMEKCMPEHSLEKKHAIEVLRWSINALYEEESWDEIIENSFYYDSRSQNMIRLKAYLKEHYNPPTKKIK